MSARFRVENLPFVRRLGIPAVTSSALMKMNVAETILSRTGCMPHSATESKQTRHLVGMFLERTDGVEYGSITPGFDPGQKTLTN